MSDKLYRRNEDGLLEAADSNVPKAHGKAAAFDAWLAQGGTPFRASGRYKKGPFKGKNYDEAKAMFERMWETSPDQVKQKYADRTSGKVTDLAPSERSPRGEVVEMPAVSNPKASPQQNRMKQYADQRANRIQQTTGTRPPTAAPVANSRAVTAETPKAPADNQTGLTTQATPAQSSDKYLTADTGDGAIRAAIAMQAEQLRQDAIANPPAPTIERVQPAPPVATPAPAPVTMGGSPAAAYGQRPAAQAPAPMAVADLRRADEQRVPQVPAQPALRPIPSAAVTMGGSVGASYGQSLPKVDYSTSPEVAAELAAKQAAEAEQRAATTAVQNKAKADALAASERARLGLGKQPSTQPFQQVAQPVQPQAVGQVAQTAPAVTNTVQPAVGPPRSAMNAPELTGNAGVQPRINPATRLPFGYRPGDDVAPAQAADAAGSVMRQAQAQASRPLPAPPVAQPAPAPVRYAAAQSQYQAGKAPATAMDAVYTGASGQEKAAITAQSLKRAAALPTTVNAPRAIPVTNPRRPIPAPPVGRPRFALAR